MSRKQALQSPTPAPHEPDGDRQIVLRACKVGDPLPLALDAHDLAAIFGRSLNTIYDWKKAGKLRRFELRQPMGAKRWSGRLLQQHLDGSGAALSVVTRVSA